MLLAAALLTLQSGDLGHKSRSWPIEICGLTAPTPVALYEQVMALPDAKLVQQTEDYLTTRQEAKGHIWTLVINNHPAAPAVICRTIEARNGKVALDMSVACFATKDACDKLTRDFAEHNRLLLQRAENSGK